MNPSTIEILGSCFFALAILHTFGAKYINAYAARFPEGSKSENLFHLLGEVEVVFGLWAGVFVLFYALIEGSGPSMSYMNGLNFTEPLFVFVIMATAATRPMIESCERAILKLSHLLPLPKHIRFYLTVMSVGPLLGSFITEPAAMTLLALILKHRYYARGVSLKFQYATLATLFVNVSIGGVLTNFAAPPVVMVAGEWNWDLAFMFTHFGWKAIIAVLINAKIATTFLSSELAKVEASFGQGEMPAQSESEKRKMAVPFWLTVLNIIFLVVIVATAHYPQVFVGVFLYFIGVAYITQEYQDELKLRESLLVAFFLGGLVVLGGVQGWWLQPLLAGTGEAAIFFGAAGLTAVTDNAALTYLGSQVPGLSDALKYFLVAGAVAGGGLTVIANAPNPAGLAILKEDLDKSGGFDPFRLLLFALVPTGVALAAFGLLS